MIRKIGMLLYLYLNCFTVLACIYPNGGSEYDSKIKLYKLSAKDLYRLEVPKRLKDSGAVKVYLGYSKESDLPTRFLEYDMKLSYWFEGEVVDIEFTAPIKEGYKAYIHVIWPGDVCDTIANSVNLDEIE